MIYSMGIRCGIVGLPNVGKSTIFNALTAAGVPAENYPFCTTEPHVGTLEAPDPRLEKLREMLGPERTVPAVLEFVDIAGLIKGSSEGLGMGNEFLDNIKNVDAVAHVVRCFADPSISFHEAHQGLDPAADADAVEFELIQKDLQWVEKRMEKAQKLLRTGDKTVKHELELFQRMEERLNREESLREMEFSEEDEPMLRELGPLTLKPMFYVANMGEDEMGPESTCLSELKGYASGRDREVVAFYAKLEAEIAELSPDERPEFRKEMGLSESGVDAIVSAGMRALDLVTFYTKVGPELRAWTVPRGTGAARAAGVIHTDFEKGFIKAEVASFDDFVEAGSEAEAGKRGVLRREGRDYQVKDGDVIHFRFNV